MKNGCKYAQVNTDKVIPHKHSATLELSLRVIGLIPIDLNARSGWLDDIWVGDFTLVLCQLHDPHYLALG